MKALTVLAFGFWLGLRHASDADHVVAVSTIVARTRKLGTSWLLGAAWGLGHTLTIFAVGAAIILLKLEIPPRLGLSLELCVAAALVALGLLNLSGRGLGALGVPRHSHPHDHADPEHRHDLLDGTNRHSHEHAHLREVRLAWLKSRLRDAGLFQLLRAAAVGLVHGLAGSAAGALLVLATIGDPRAAVLYLLVFGAGTLVGMLALSSAMELAFFRLAAAWGRLDRSLTIATGLLSIGFGLWVAWRVGMADGLFAGEPRWTPR